MLNGTPARALRINIRGAGPSHPYLGRHMRLRDHIGRSCAWNWFAGRA